MPFDYKKEYKEFYLPPGTPVITDIPAMNFVAVQAITKGTRVSIIAEGPDEEEAVKALTDMLVKEVF